MTPSLDNGGPGAVRFHRVGSPSDGRVKPELLARGVETVTVAYENDTN